VALVLAGLAAVPAGALVAIPSFRLSGIYLAVATFGFGLLMQNLMYTSPAMFGLENHVSIQRPELLGVDTASDTAYYYVVLIVAAICAGLVLLVRRSRLGRILAALADSPAALEAHAVRTKVTRLSVFCFAAFLAAIGGALIGGSSHGAGGDPAGPFSYFNSLVLVAVLAFCGRRPVLAPVVGAFLFFVAKIYPPFDSAFLTDYRGAFFGLLAIGVAVFPGIRMPALHERGAQRPGVSPVAARRSETHRRPFRAGIHGGASPVGVPR
jgi:ABC-type branched-subunit amino acid transport system permease subunit